MRPRKDVFGLMFISLTIREKGHHSMPSDPGHYTHHLGFFWNLVCC